MKRSAESRAETVASLERGLDVLRAFDGQAAMQTLSQVADKTGLKPASARRYLRTLEQLGYLARRERHYLLRPRVLEFGTLYLDAVNIEELCRQHLQDVVRQTGSSSSLSILVGHEIVYLAHVGVRRRFRAEARVGSRYPAHATSMGRALLAQLDDDALARYLAEAPLEKLTDKTVTDPARLRARIVACRGCGYALVRDELDYGILAIAVPVLDADGHGVAAINCSAHSLETDAAEMIETRLPILRRAGAEIGHSLRRFPQLSYSVRP